MKYLLKCKILVQKQRQDEARPTTELMAKRVELAVIGPLHDSVPLHAPDDCRRAPDEHQLHHGVVDGDEVGEQIQVARHKHQRVQLLSLE